MAPEDDATSPPAAASAAPQEPARDSPGIQETSPAAQSVSPLQDSSPAVESGAETPAPMREESRAGAPPAAPLPEPSPPKIAQPTHYFIARHSATVRVTHWLNAIILAVMLMSGLQIFNAHPALYWGHISDFDRPLMSLRAERASDGRLIGITTLFGARFETTGVLGASRYRDAVEERGFPAWTTLPGGRWLAMGRRWHFFFAWLFVLNGLAYVAYALARRHVQKDLLPTRSELKGIGRSIWDHLRFHFHKGEAARRYNVLQKLAYLGVVFVLGPLVVLSGLAMSPMMNAAMPWLPEIFGGRQSARTIHFLCALGFVGFFLIHIVMVLVSGAWNNIRSMITGRYAIMVKSGDGH